MDIITYILCKTYTDSAIMGTVGPLKGKDGHSPYIDSGTETWFEFDDTTQVYIDTGIPASGTCVCQANNTILGVPIKFIGTTYGGWRDGDIAPSTMLLSDFLIKMAQKTATPPTYIQPTISISGSIPLSYEIGSLVTPVITPTWTQNNAGLITQYVLKKDNVAIYTNSTANIKTDTQFQLTQNVVYQAVVSYGEGSILPDSEGVPYPTGHIQAGSKNSNMVTYSSFRKSFNGISTDANPIPPTTSSEIRALPSSSDNPIAGNSYPVVAQIGTKMIVFSYPKSLGEITSITQESISMDVKAGFTKTVVPVTGANGYDPVDYYVYYITTEFAFAGQETYIFKI